MESFKLENFSVFLFAILNPARIYFECSLDILDVFSVGIPVSSVKQQEHQGERNQEESEKTLSMEMFPKYLSDIPVNFCVHPASFLLGLLIVSFYSFRDL